MEIKKLRPGMVVASPVHDSRKNIILPKGAVITERNIRSLSSWGIKLVDIEGVGDISDENLGDRIRSNPVLFNKCKKLDSMFSNIGQDNLMEEIKGLVKRHFIRKYGNK